MNSSKGVLCQKIVTSTEIDLTKIELPALSEKVQQTIRDAKIESLQDLLRADSQRVLRQMVEQYWNTR